MVDRASLRVLSIAHTAVSRAAGRMRYLPLGLDKRLDIQLVVPQRWFQFGRWYDADPADDPGITVTPLPIRFPTAGPANWYCHYYPSLAKQARAFRPDVIHLWEEPWSVVALHASFLARRLGAKLVLEVDQNILKRLPAPFELIRRHVLARTDFVLSRSDDATETVRACGYTGPAAPIGYGVDGGVFFPHGQSPGRERLALGYVGRIVAEKGLEEVLAAMAASRAPATLSILGEGPYRPVLEALAERLGVSDRLDFQPWTDPAGVAAFLRRCHATILMTRQTPDVKEQFGRVIIESQACGTPVIGAATGAIPAVVGDGGWIVPERDCLALARLLDRLGDHPDEVAARGRAGVANVVARFTHQAVADQLASGWRRAAGRLETPRPAPRRPTVHSTIGALAGSTAAVRPPGERNAGPVPIPVTLAQWRQP